MRPRLLLSLTINWKFAVDFFARGLHTRTAVARLPLRQLGFLVSLITSFRQCRRRKSYQEEKVQKDKKMSSSTRSLNATLAPKRNPITSVAKGQAPLSAHEFPQLKITWKEAAQKAQKSSFAALVESGFNQ